MALPTLSGVARLVADPELRIANSGTPVARVRLAFNSRRQNKQTGQWEDGDTFWISGTAFNQLAENIAETLAKGMEITVTGELKTEQWEKDGQKHQAPALMIRSIGPSLAYATARVQRAERDGNGRQTPAQASARPQQTGWPQQPQYQQPQDDPWAVNGAGDQPPF